MFWDTVTSSWAFQSYNSNPSVRNLEVTFDSSMKFDEQSQRKSLWLRQAFSDSVFWNPRFNRPNLEKAIRAFISSRIEYRSAPYASFSQSVLSRLQLVQSAAARLLTNTPRRQHITPLGFQSAFEF